MKSYCLVFLKDKQHFFKLILSMEKDTAGLDILDDY